MPSPWAFVHVPRTGGTTMRAMLKKYVSEETNGMGPVWPERRGHLPAWKLAELMDERNQGPNWDEFWSFAVVRNPFDRAVSLWT